MHQDLANGKKFTASPPRPYFLAAYPQVIENRIATVVCIPLTSNLKWALAPGNVHLPARLTGLKKDSVANVSQIVSVDSELLTARVGKLPRSYLELMHSGIDTILGK